MEFVMEMAGAEQIEELVEIMEDAARNVQKKEWFAAGDRACLLDALLGNSFVILARERESREAAGFLPCSFLRKRKNTWQSIQPFLNKSGNIWYTWIRRL